jgi:hypothetical protein
MDYNLAVIGNDEAAMELLCLSAESGRPTVAILPESCQSSWLVGLALKRLVADLLVDQCPGRKQLLRRTGSPRLLRQLLTRAIARETNDLVNMLERINVDVHIGQPRFMDKHNVTIADGRDCQRLSVNARYFAIGTGVRPTAMHRPLGLVALHRPEMMLEGNELPSSICLLGGDEFGCGMAALFSLFGVQSRHVAREGQDSSMLELARAAGVEIAFHPSEFGLRQSSGVLSNSHADVVDCRRSVGFTEHLNLAAIDIEPDENGQLWCSSSLETWCRGVFGVGDVVGFSPETAVHPVVQANRIHQRINTPVPRPHALDLFVAASINPKSAPRKGLAAINN